MHNIDQKDFMESKFEKIEFKENIESKRFLDCEFVKCSFAEIEIAQCQFTDCVFIECNLSLAKVTDSSFLNVAFDQSKVIGVNWAKAKWPQFKLESPLSFYHSNISDSSFFELSLSYLVLESCQARDVDFRSADLSNSSLTYCDFQGSHFVNSNLTSADFTGSENYNIDVFENTIKNAKFSLPEALSLLDHLGIKIVDLDKINKK